MLTSAILLLASRWMEESTAEPRLGRRSEHQWNPELCHGAILGVCADSAATRAIISATTPIAFLSRRLLA